MSGRLRKRAVDTEVGKVEAISSPSSSNSRMPDLGDSVYVHV